MISAEGQEAIGTEFESDGPHSGPVLRPPTGDPTVSEELVQQILQSASDYFAHGEHLPRAPLESLFREAIRTSDDVYGVEAALKWAEGYEFPQAMLDSDLRCFRAAQLDFQSMVRRRLKGLSDDRLSASRVDGLRPDNPVKDLMYDLANGMRVPLPTGFLPNGTTPTAKLRSTYLKVHPAVNRMLGEVVQQRLAFVLPKKLAIEMIPNLHLSAAHWTIKKGKPCGRPIGDMTYVTGTPLNTPETTTAAAESYGQILHPTIEGITKMVLKFWDKACIDDPTARWEDLRIWKMDLKGAYTLLSFRPEDAGLFGMEVTGELVYLQIAGIFGWACTPAAFHVVTRAIKWELDHLLRSLIDMYVDDIIGVCLIKDLESDLAEARRVCTSLLGSKAVADDKTEWGTRLDIIGYVIDLGLKRVSIARKNFLNTVYGFFTVDVERPIKLKVAQKLASWSSRYGKICRAMRPFSSALHELSSGWNNHQVEFPISEEAKTAIRCWRAMLYLVHFDERRFTRTLQSFSDAPPTYVIEFDASLSGAGIIWFKRAGGTEECLGGSAVDLRALKFGDDSSYQNVCEFIGVVLGVIGLVIMGVRDADVQLRGDSVSALTWAEAERYRGKRVTNAAMVYTVLCVMYSFDVKEATHVPGTDNKRCDKLSRLGETGGSVEETMREFGLQWAASIDISQHEHVQKLISACDPAQTHESESNFIEYWGRMRDALKGIGAHHKSTSGVV